MTRSEVMRTGRFVQTSRWRPTSGSAWRSTASTLSGSVFQSGGRRQKLEDGSLGKLKVQSKYNHGTEFVDEFNKIWLEGVGLAVNPKNGKLLYNELERSGVDNIYAIGDVLVTTGCVYVCTTVREDN